MLHREHLAALIALAVAAVARPADACGPDFPIELLADRDTHLAELPEGIFVDEVAALVPVEPAFRDPCQGLAPPEDAPPDEDPGDTWAQQARADAARAWAACTAARAVPPAGWLEDALYRRGADAFHHGSDAEAAGWFTAVLALPPAARAVRSSSAAYSLARLSRGDAARAWYREVRALVAAGYVDPDGLAAASLRQEAWLAETADTALPLWAARAALGYRDAKDELLAIARAAIRERIERSLVATELGQRLLAAYLYSRDGELTDGERARLWAMIDALPRLAGADRLAAAAYRRGAWAQATALVARADDSALAGWVRAKLAARAGDVVGAADLACRAAEALPTTSDCDDFICGGYLARDRALGDCAMLELAADRPVSAMRHAWAAHHRYRDALYIADRVLTTAELRGFIDELAAQSPDDTADDWFLRKETLTTLYGRRLMREGRLAEALPWLPGPQRAPALGYGDYLALAEQASDRLVRAEALFRASMIARFAGMEIMGTAHGPDWAIEDGSYDLDAYTDGPDSARGHYGDPWTYDQPSDDADDDATDDDAADDDAAETDAAPPVRRPASRWVTDRERARVARSAPRYALRFHYRYRAVALAREALALVPAYAEAHAAIACWVDDYPHGHSSEYLGELRAHYLGDGAFPDDGCPEPDFAEARHARPPTYHGRAMRTWRQRHPRAVARVEHAVAIALPVGGAVALIALARAVLRRRARRGAAVP